MGTIAELLGYTLPEDPGPQGPEGADSSEPPVGDEGDTGPDRSPGERQPEGSTDPVGEAVMAAVLAETSLEPGDARPDLELTGPELDLDRLGRYSVVTSVEHELKVQFADADVESWRTLGDVLEAARDAVGPRPRARGR